MDADDGDDGDDDDGGPGGGGKDGDGDGDGDDDRSSITMMTVHLPCAGHNDVPTTLAASPTPHAQLHLPAQLRSPSFSSLPDSFACMFATSERLTKLLVGLSARPRCVTTGRRHSPPPQAKGPTHLTPFHNASHIRGPFEPCASPSVQTPIFKTPLFSHVRARDSSAVGPPAAPSLPIARAAARADSSSR
eukprot:3117928-Rhodomonas_salina.6